MFIFVMLTAADIDPSIGFQAIDNLSRVGLQHVEISIYYWGSYR